MPLIPRNKFVVQAALVKSRAHECCVSVSRRSSIGSTRRSSRERGSGRGGDHDRILGIKCMKSVRGIGKRLHFRVRQCSDGVGGFRDQHAGAAKPEQVVDVRSRVFMAVIVERKK